MISRGDHVSHQMLRTLCCRSNKVEEDKNTTEAINDYRSTAFVFISSTVLARNLLGVLFSALEAKGLKTTQMLLAMPNSAKVEKSSLLRSKGVALAAGQPAVFSLWRGNDVIGRVTEVVRRIGNQYSVGRVDILFTENATQTRKEAELWFESEPAASPISNGAPAPPAAEEEEEAVVEERAGDVTNAEPEVTSSLPAQGEIVENRESADNESVFHGDVEPLAPADPHTVAPTAAAK